MIAAIDATSLAGVWAASRPAVADRRWFPAPPQFTEHYFLVIERGPDGKLTAFVRNPEYNIGAFLRNRTVSVTNGSVALAADGRPAIRGVLQSDATLAFADLVDGGPLSFHRAGPADMKWYNPLPSTSWTYQTPTVMHDGWPVSRLESVGMSATPLNVIMQSVAGLRSPTLRSEYIQSISIERHGKLVLDQYFYGFTPQQAHDMRSAGKSVTTLMVGRAIAETRAFSPASRVLNVLSRYRPVKNDDARKENMTVGDLMTMSSGLACDDNDDQSPGNEDTMQSQPAGTDWYRYTLDLPIIAEPGTIARYCSAGINLLGAVIYTATQTPLDRLFATDFAQPLQFDDYAMWLMPAPANQAYMAGGDYMRPRDFLKFGALILNHGQWRGGQIVSSDWIAQSIVPRSAPIDEGDRYGYGWHLSTITVNGRSYDIVSAGGNGGQLLIVVPQLDLAIMVTAGNYGQYSVWRTFEPDIASAAIQACLSQH